MKEVRWSQFITEELRFAESESLKNDARQTVRQISLSFDIKDLTHEHQSVPGFFRMLSSWKTRNSQNLLLQEIIFFD